MMKLRRILRFLTHDFGTYTQLLGRRSEELDHPLAQGITDQEVGFRVAELVVAVTGVGRVLGKSNEIMGLDLAESPQERPADNAAE